MTPRQSVDGAPIPEEARTDGPTPRRAADRAASPRDRRTLEDWSNLVLHRCGLALRESQMPALVELVNARMGTLGVTSPEEYRHRLEAEPVGSPEWTRLADRLANHETSFFRHPRSFEVLARAVLPDLRRRRRTGRALSLWSAGCSTGQEAYSLAMVAMADEAIGGEFTVWGTDLSRRALETARRGRYGAKAVAAVPPAYRHRYLRATSAAAHAPYEVVDALRRRVRFVTGNLFAADHGVLIHDVVFCQNVLIYFAPSAIPALVSRLAARLAVGGYLLLGPGEAPTADPAGLEPAEFGGVRAFRRTGRLLTEVRP